MVLSHLGSWQTRLILGSNTLSRPIPIKCGIFQGDSLSPLLFCLALNPISHELRSSGLGYGCGPPSCRQPICHLWYMDDLKVFSSTSAKLASLLSTVELIAGDFGMKFNANKSAWLEIHRGTPPAMLPPLETLHRGSHLPHVDVGSSYRYLGVAERAAFCI